MGGGCGSRGRRERGDRREEEDDFAPKSHRRVSQLGHQSTSFGSIFFLLRPRREEDLLCRSSAGAQGTCIFGGGAEAKRWVVSFESPSFFRPNRHSPSHLLLRVLTGMSSSTSSPAPSQALFLAASVHLTSTPSAASLSSATKLQVSSTSPSPPPFFPLFSVCRTSAHFALRSPA